MVQTCLVPDNKSSGKLESFSNCTNKTNKTDKENEYLENKYRDILDKAKVDQEKLQLSKETFTESQGTNCTPPKQSQVQSNPVTPMGFFFYSDNVNSICHTSELSKDEIDLIERVSKLDLLSGEAKAQEQKNINYDITLLSYRHKRIFQDKLREQREVERKERELYYARYEKSCGSSRYSPDYKEGTILGLDVSTEEGSYTNTEEDFCSYLELRGIETGKVEVVPCSNKPFNSTYIKSTDKVVKIKERRLARKVRELK